MFSTGTEFLGKAIPASDTPNMLRQRTHILGGMSPLHSRLFTLWGRVRTGSEVVPGEVSSSFGLRLILLQMLDAGEFLNTLSQGCGESG